MQVKVEPCPSVDWTRSWPLRFLTIRATSASPRPTTPAVPDSLGLSSSPIEEMCSNARKICSSDESEMPHPVSVLSRDQHRYPTSERRTDMEMPMRIESFFASASTTF